MSGPGRARRNEPTRNALVLALVTLALVALSPLCYRLGFAAFGALALLAVAFLTGFAAIRLALPALMVAGGRSATDRALAALAVLIAAAPLVLPAAYGLRALAGGGALLVNDITTDTDDPPAFVALRAVHRKSADYDAAKFAAAQRKTYPDIAPVSLDEAPEEAFAQAQRVAAALGWHVVDANPEEGRIEATDTTRLYRFTDDIVIRIRAEGEGARVDIRSASRIGQGDLGTNARRVRAFMKALKSGP